MRFRRLTTVLAICQSLLAISALHAEPTYALLPDARAMHPPVAQPIPGSERANLAAVKMENGEVAYLSKEAVAQLEAANPNFQTLAKTTATQLLETLKPQLIRDKSKVVECAIFSSDSPLTTAVVLAPQFLEKYEPLFGPEVIVAMPTRYQVYVFPKIANRLSKYAPDILTDFRAAAYPVSPEVFELGPNGIRAVGLLDDR